MAWRKIVGGTVVALALAVTGCSDGPKGPGVPTPVESACDKANDGKRLQVEGYLDFPKSFKSKEITIMMRLRPALEASAKVVGVSVGLGNAANQVELPPKEFTPADMKVHTQDGKVIGYRDKVKVTGTMYYPSSMAQVEFQCGLTNTFVESAGR